LALIYYNIFIWLLY